MSVIAPKPAAAQGELGIGWQYINYPDFDFGGYPLGFNVDYAYPLAELPFSIAAEFGWSRHSDDDLGSDFTSSLFNFGVGPRFNFDVNAGVRPYAQVLFGLQHDKDHLEGTDDLDFHETSFMWQPGAGVGFPVNDTWDLFGQVDFRQTAYEGESEWGVRFVIGGRLGF